MTSAASILRDARLRAGLSQAALASASGTSQTAISAYESGTKEPGVATLSRLLAATGMRLTVVAAPGVVVEPSAAQLAEAGRTLFDVIALAETLPVRYEPELRYPRLPVAS
jgi:transcriptional regulator with XRE-family HTH domain